FAASTEAAGYARAHAALGVGLHLDLGEWRFAAGEWVPVYEVVDVDDPPAVEAEVTSQLARFADQVGRAPTHLDSHQHVHRREPVRSLVAAMGERLGVPVREQSPTVRYRGDFYGQDEDGTPAPERISADALIALVR